MNLLQTVLTGMGVLILVYLGVKNAPGVATVFNSGGTQAGHIIKDLQGR